MARKIGFGVVATVFILGALWVLGAATLGPAKTNSLVACTFRGFQQDVNDQVPVEVEIERIRHDINQINPDMKKELEIIAQETVAVRNLRKDVETIEVNVNKQKKDMLVMSEQLEKADRSRASFYQVELNNREYTVSQAEAKLERELAIYKKNKAELKAKKDLLEAKERSLESSKQQLAAMKDQKRELEIQLAKLEADFRTLQVHQTKSKYQFDGSRMEAIKKSMQELQDRLDKENEQLRLYEEFALEGRPVQTKKETKDIVREVRETVNEPNATLSERD